MLEEQIIHSNPVFIKRTPIVTYANSTYLHNGARGTTRCGAANGRGPDGKYGFQQDKYQQGGIDGQAGLLKLHEWLHINGLAQRAPNRRNTVQMKM